MYLPNWLARLVGASLVVGGLVVCFTDAWITGPLLIGMGGLWLGLSRKRTPTRPPVT